MQFTPGSHYIVKIKGQRRVRRIYKWPSTRFDGQLACHVFTSRVSSSVRATWDANTETLRMTGPKLPRSEISIPEYLIAHATLAEGR